MTKTGRFILILACLALALVGLWPTYNWYYRTSDEMETMANATSVAIQNEIGVKTRNKHDELIALTKDSNALNSPIPEEFSFLVKIAKENYKNLNLDKPSDWMLQDVLAGFSDSEALYFAMEDHYRNEVYDLKDLKSKAIKLGLDIFGGLSVVLEPDRASLAERMGAEPTDAEYDEAIDVAMMTLTSRLDQWGLSEPEIRRTSTGDQTYIRIEVSGDVSPEAVNSFLNGKGRLGFHLVDQVTANQVASYAARHNNFISLDENGIPNDPSLVIPAGVKVVGEYAQNSYGIDVIKGYTAIFTDVALDGTFIKDVDIAYTDQGPNVVFNIAQEGQDKFYNVTSANVGKPLAVVMDDKVKSVANIRVGLLDNVSVEGFSSEEAQALETILKSAALPIDLNVKSLNQVGSTLGQETIESGLKAIAIGFGAVFIFMLFWYRRAGFIADIALLLNLFFIIAVLSAFNLTLTMTSIAGIILNIGMSVDANVIIFERIKEELSVGKTRAAAIDAGFRKALWTVLDANITTFIAALFLSMLGTGPVKGFAITLAVGIVSSLITAIFISRFLFDLGTDGLSKEKLKIKWGSK